MAPLRLSPERRVQELLNLCRAGKLYEIEEWIARGESLHVPEQAKRTPLEIAVENGFHSLVLLLARNETSTKVKNKALAAAVRLKRFELVELLLAHGAEINGVPFADVLLTWEPKLIRFFLDRGADVATSFPFAEAFGSKVRTALRPFIEYRNAHPELASELQEQIDRALRHFSHSGDLKWVSLLLWAGANPRSRGPRLYERDDPDCYETALEIAACGESLDVLKRLKPDSNLDNLSELLFLASLRVREEMVRYLLGLGAAPNRKMNGGSAPIDRCWWHIDLGILHYRRGGLFASTFSLYQTFRTMEALLERGALWLPDDRRQMDAVRKTLSACEPKATVQWLQLLVKYKAASEETIRNLLATPGMREHLSKEWWWLARLRLKHLLYTEAELKRKSRSPKDRIVSRVLSSRYDRESLYEKVWRQPMQKLAKEFGISDVGLAKICRKLFVPLPGRGYWARKAAGQKMGPKPALLPVQTR
jgi:hypothetical protein